MSGQNEDVLLGHDEEEPASAGPASSALAPEAASRIASEMHRWGRALFRLLARDWWPPGPAASPAARVKERPYRGTRSK